MPDRTVVRINWSHIHKEFTRVSGWETKKLDITELAPLPLQSPGRLSFNTPNLRGFFLSISLKLWIKDTAREWKQTSPAFQWDSSVPPTAQGSFFGCSTSSVVIEMETQNFSPVGFCFPFHQNLTEISACLWVPTKGIQTWTDEKTNCQDFRALQAGQSVCLPPTPRPPSPQPSQLC